MVIIPVQVVLSDRLAMSYQTSAMDPKHAATYHGGGGHGHQYSENIASDPVHSAISQFQNMTLGHPAMGQMNTGMPYMVPQAQEGPYMLAHIAAGHIGLDHLGHPNPYGHAGAYHIAPVGGSYAPYPMMPFTPGRAAALQDRTNRAGHSEAPGLENRRGSYSTNESTPATPFYQTMAKHDHGPRVAVHDRSTYTTPSPQQLGPINVFPDPAVKQNVIAIPVDRNLDELLRQDPPIPKAVPAVFTPAAQMKSLDQSLENRIPGNRNVYIRGLHPTTDDELLFHYAARFGDVETSKAIIDTSTGACKGFGFAKFYDARDSEVCIRGFHRLGYEVGFARESFNSRLKAEGDEGSTNLYISNLPKSLTEVELGAIFMGYTILSSKILRDSMGNSRGVGFARFESRDVCDEVIKEYNGIGVGDEGLLMNIRYADTPSQKELKRVTAERRQFRTNEYNIGAYGTPLVGMQPNMYNQPAWKRSIPTSSTTTSAHRSLQGMDRSTDREVSSSGSKSHDAGSVQGHGQAQSATEATLVVIASSEDGNELATTPAKSKTVVNSTQSSPAVKRS
ncbi:RNA recognition domain-containing protein [Verticillium dahliae]|nr:4-hydroxy-2-oxo-heptane-1,7-dioate aldolase [Verticillium dahliae VDG2]